MANPLFKFQNNTNLGQEYLIYDSSISHPPYIPRHLIISQQKYIDQVYL